MRTVGDCSKCPDGLGHSGKTAEEKNMENKKIGEYLNSGVEYLKALDFEYGETRTYSFHDVEEVDFEDGPKAMLVLADVSTGVENGFVLNTTNLNFLIESGYSDFGQLNDKKITIKKEEREFEGKKIGKRKNVGLFIIKVE